MGADADERGLSIGMKQGDDVADFVDVDIIQFEGFKAPAEPVYARDFAKRRRGDLSEFALPAAEFMLLIVQPGKSRVDAAHLSNAGNLALGRGA